MKKINEPYDCPICFKRVEYFSAMGEKLVQNFQAGTVTGLSTIKVCAASDPISRIGPV